MLLAGEGIPAGAESVAQTVNTSLIIVLNAYSNPLHFTLPKTQYAWHSIFTTGSNELFEGTLTEQVIEPRSVQLFELKT